MQLYMETFNHGFMLVVAVACSLTSSCCPYVLSAPTITEESNFGNFVVHNPNRKCNASVLCTNEEMNFTMVCGNDGRTYYTLCEIKRAVCSGEPVEKLSDGPCLEGQVCLLAKEFQLKLTEKDGQEVYIPQCNDTDGSFLPTQCHHSMGYCWCADRYGRPILGTSTRFSHPECHHVAEERISIKVGRRSHRVTNTEMEGITVVDDDRGCAAADRSVFNAQLYKVFEEDFDGRLVKFNDQPKPLVVIKEKFDEFDLDKDALLNKSEVRLMKKKLRKTRALPRPCMRRLFRNCDLNCNGTIEPDEWLQCLEVNISTSEKSFDSLRENATYYSYETELPPGATNEVKYIDGNPADLEISLKNTTTNFLNAERKNSRKQLKNEIEDERADCRRERNRVLEQTPAEDWKTIYVPSCTGPNDSLYNAKQCHPGQQICWCVKPDGTLIPGTTSSDIECDPKSYESDEETVLSKPAQNVKPRRKNDGAPKKSNRITKKGCVDKKMKKFLRLHMNTLKVDCYDMGNCMKSTNVAMEAALRKFNEIDANKNKEIGRNEWKNYRNFLIQSQTFMGVRKCAKQFLKFCDINENRKISKDEWVNCTVKGFSMLPRRLTKLTNPFLDVLHYDD